MNPKSPLYFFLILPLVLFAAIPAKADTEKLKTFEDRFSQIQKEFQEGSRSETFLLDINQQFSSLQQKVEGSITSTESEISKLASQIDSLGNATDGEPAEIGKKREELKSAKTRKEKELSQYQFLRISIEEQLQKSSAMQKSLLAKRILNKGPNIATLVQEPLIKDTHHIRNLSAYFFDHHGVNLIEPYDALLLIALFILSALFGVMIKKKIRQWIASRSWSQSLTDRIVEAFAYTSARYVTPLLVFTVLSLGLLQFLPYTNTIPAILLLSSTLVVYLICVAIVQMLFTPVPPARLIFEITVEQSSMIAWRMSVVLTIALVSYILLYAISARDVPLNLALLIKDICATSIIISLMWLVFGFRKIPSLSKYRRGRIILYLFLGITLATELTGYRNFAFTTLRIATSLTVGFAIFLLIARIFKEFFDALDEGTRPWHKPIRATFGLRAKEHIPGLTLFRVLTTLAIWVGFLYFAIRALGLSQPVLQGIHDTFYHGFKIGTFNFNPTRILFAIAAFAVLFSLSSWIKNRLDKKWLSRTRIERGAREAIVTMAGYMGVAIAILFAMGIAGVTFTNLAIIAGALSVGIGFGLQNIVNNFVSGLILLFERPIKKGDWIIVGGTEGYVKRISIRSTQIQTFDRADVIVPNSDLISNQVTNWMLYNSGGRIRVPVGVAYGSDTEKVRDLLIQVAESHDSVVQNNPDFPIRVMFLNFGDSSLNFELRCFIKDIDSALTVRSDLNFAIDKIFRDNNVHIPFPQRDIHIISTGNKDELSAKSGITNQ